MLKNLKDDAHVSFELDKISSARVRNVARAYAWWLAKDCCTLSILKVGFHSSIRCHLSDRSFSRLTSQP